MKTVLKTIWNVLKSNLVMKIMAVLFAVILWSYVLAEIDPPRTRIVTDVGVEYRYLNELNDNNLEISETLNNVNVKVEIKQSEIKNLTKENIDVFVDLSTINGPGEQTLVIQAKPNGIAGANVVEISPKTVTVHVDKSMSKPVPVEVKTIGSVPDGYYASEPVIAPTTVEIKGAQTHVLKVASAVCNVDLTGLTEGYSKNMDIELLDYEGNIIDKNLFDDLPSVIVKLDVQHMKTVPVDAAGSIVGQDEVAAGYEVADITCVPETVQIAGSASALVQVDKISLAPYSISGKSTSESVALDYDLPEGVSVLTPEKAQVYITIREIMKTKTYSGINLEEKNLAKGLNVRFSEPKVDVTVMAGTSKVSKLSRSDIVPYVDLDGLAAGTHSLKVLFEIPEGFAEENFTSSAGTVTVTIY
jgi:YbbR domain-containing protein